MKELERLVKIQSDRIEELLKYCDYFASKCEDLAKNLTKALEREEILIQDIKNQSEIITLLQESNFDAEHNAEKVELEMLIKKLEKLS